MSVFKPAVVVTGVAGNLGLRLLPQLRDFSVIGIDVNPPKTDQPLRFVRVDLGQESSREQLVDLFKETRPLGVVHLAFVLDQVRMGVFNLEHMWQINVAGTTRVMEAIAEANRGKDRIEKFIFPSSVSAYGPSRQPLSEDSPLEAHTYPYGMHKRECDEVVQQRAPSLGGCSVYILRPHIFAGPSVDNYLVGIFRGTPNGKSRLAARLRARGLRLPCVLPFGKEYLQNRVQYVHIDDVARLIAHILRRGLEAEQITILNVAGRGDPLTIARCIEISGCKVIRVPGQWACQLGLRLAWSFGISAIPPEITPYMTGQCTMTTDRLRAFLGSEYEAVMQHTVEQAFVESLVGIVPGVAAAQPVAG
ncbi:MAG TPA: NAD-dependent epimerase/dehydratase family protein [Terriglobales bacterium]|nr:NAD-dependent epimerase/dehydratase family protein [Terriglobales bacterium]